MAIHKAERIGTADAHGSRQPLTGLPTQSVIFRDYSAQAGSSAHSPTVPLRSSLLPNIHEDLIRIRIDLARRGISAVQEAGGEHVDADSG